MNPPQYRENTITEYYIAEKNLVGNVKEKIENYDLLTAIMICLGTTDDNSSGILKLLEVLLSTEREVEEKKKILQEDLTDSVVFLTGVGKCHPIIASHNILNNLHQVLDSVPVVMFYPGEYSGQDLKLFGTMDSRNYYRAFQLV